VPLVSRRRQPPSARSPVPVRRRFWAALAPGPSLPGVLCRRQWTPTRVHVASKAVRQSRQPSDEVTDTLLGLVQGIRTAKNAYPIQISPHHAISGKTTWSKVATSGHLER
jgi:hypothetical protein